VPPELGAPPVARPPVAPTSPPEPELPPTPFEVTSEPLEEPQASTKTRALTSAPRPSRLVMLIDFMARK
jgi:hypothetical protein